MGKQNSEATLINQKTVFDSAFITAIYALFWAYLIGCVLFPLHEWWGFPRTTSYNADVLAGFATFVGVQWILLRSPHLYSKERFGIVLALSCLLAVPLLTVIILAAFDVEAAWWIKIGAWLAWGGSAGLLYPLIGSAWSIIDRAQDSRKSSPKLVCASFLGTAFLTGALFFMPDTICAITLALYYLLAFALFTIIINRLPDIKTSGSDVFKEKFNPTSSSRRIFPLIIGAGFSLTACFSQITYGSETTLILCAAACLGAGALMFIGVHIEKLPIVNALIERTYFPLSACCFMLLSLLPSEFSLIPLFVLLTLFFIYAIFHWSFLLAIAHRFGFSSPYHFSLGLLNPALGITAGWLASGIYLATLGQSLGFMPLFFGFVVLFVIVVSIAPYASDPTFEIDVLDPDITEAMDSEHRGLWKQKCRTVADEAFLSPREYEVFELLARGRNVEYIQKKLYISVNTVKTHKYRIFRKLDIESHQELLDLIETSHPQP